MSMTCLFLNRFLEVMVDGFSLLQAASSQTTQHSVTCALCMDVQRMRDPETFHPNGRRGGGRGLLEIRSPTHPAQGRYLAAGYYFVEVVAWMQQCALA